MAAKLSSIPVVPSQPEGNNDNGSVVVLEADADRRNAVHISDPGKFKDPVEAAFRVILDSLGPAEAKRPELLKTPARAAKAWRELNASCFVGDPRNALGEGVFEDKLADGDVICVRSMAFHSLCEHHLLPFSGVAHIAYVPRGRILGLSKFARLLHALSRRPQMQERISRQFAQILFEALQPESLAVVLEATHSCMGIRGVQTPAVTRTEAVEGRTKCDDDVRDRLIRTISSGASSSSAARL
eukprot:TRINITY_DN3607_c0_g1_i2.p1 TRINITY_DN3607_c0_g1~~TRINITY_DN3607_c0_g1_i2.p1  ORF type:complete len:252 (+),score=32.36 TRINITY_DN3607_c0_g1_i2:32-757(+)